LAEWVQGINFKKVSANSTLQWQINRHFFLLGIVSAAFPGEAIRSLPESQGPWLSGQLALFYNF